MTTLITLFHPNYGQSNANRALANAAGALDAVEIVDMYGLYGEGGTIDMDLEVARLIAADRLILQFPVMWYAPPPPLNAWQDAVLTRMYYIAAEEGERLRDMPVMVAATAGNVPEAYSSQGINLFPLVDLMKPLQASASRCCWRWTEPFLLHAANRMGDEALAGAGRDYAARIAAWRTGDGAASMAQ